MSLQVVGGGRGPWGKKHTWLLESSMNRKDIIHIIITLSQLIKKEININKNQKKDIKSSQMSQQYLKIKAEKVVQAFVECK